MNNDPRWIDAYFSRIGIKSPPLPNLHGLREIHNHHLLAIPFENLSVFLSGRISLHPEKVFEKIVSDHRGGWCFEQNGLYLRVLKELGFETRSLMARSLTSPKRPRTHQIILVKIDNEVWLTDIGFGGRPMRGPIRLVEGVVQTLEGQSYQLALTSDNNPLPAFRSPDLWTLSTKINGQWLHSYEFTLESFSEADYLIANHFHVTASVSTFHEKWFVTLPTPRGRLSLLGRVLKTYALDDGKETLESELHLESVSQLQDILKELFKIKLSDPELSILWGDKVPPLHIDSGFEAS